MADSNAAGVPGDASMIAAADSACRDGRRAAIGSLDMMAHLAECGAGTRQAAVAARAVSTDVETEMERLAATRLDAA